MNIEKKAEQTLKKIRLKKNSKIIVALSGGKDSALTAYLLRKSGHKITGLHIDLKMGGYSEKCLEKVIELSRMLGIKLKIYDIKKHMGASMCYLRAGIQSRAKNQIKNCAICGVVKKWIINREARKLKADYIATGHNLDDESQTFLMNIFKGSPQLSANLGVITRNPSDKRSKFIPRIKPLFYIPEDEIKKFTQKINLPVNYEKCPCALDSYRIQVRKFVEKLSAKEKQNIIWNFEKLIEKIEKIEKKEIKYCRICREPSKRDICKKCSLLKI